MTKYIQEKNMDEQTILEVANAILDGKIVIFKTDTVYGIGTNAFDEKACQRIYEVKQRPAYKPLSLLISDLSMLSMIVESVSFQEKALMEAFWPGPFTMKLKKKKGVIPDIVSAGDDFVRVRLVSCGLAHTLIEKAGVPVVAPSANLSGHATGIDMDIIQKEFDGKVDYLLDSGKVSSDATSTIVEVQDGKALILREGRIQKDAIAKVVPLKK